MLRITEISVDGRPLRGEARTRTASGRCPVLSWKLKSDKPGGRQCRYRVRIHTLEGELWDSGTVGSDEQKCKYTGPEFPLWTELYVSVEAAGQDGESAEFTDWFYGFSCVPELKWIKAPGAVKRRPVAFRKTLELYEVPDHAMALYCGIGYSTLYVNGIRVDNARLDPAFTDFSKRCSYVFCEGFEGLLKEGVNEIVVVAADGYRNFDSEFLIGDLHFPRPRFDGDNMVSGRFVLESGKTGTVTLDIDGSWQWSYTDIVESSVYDGEIFDAGIKVSERYEPEYCPAPCEKSVIMTVPPVVSKEVYRPVDIISRGAENRYVVDFGQNLAGVVKLKLPAETVKGQKIEIRHAEILDENFDVYTAPLRKARATDAFICSGEEDGEGFWQPEYTYHGFRYVSVTGYGPGFDENCIKAISLYTDLEQAGDFRCGEPMLNAIHKACVQTEKANIHSILTDCPQRDERMGWMNDATVRFEETPYNFDIGPIFPKVVDDICDAQDHNGTITCTAPFVIGCRPADPVCSSFLVAGREYLKRSGDVPFIAAHYDQWRRWEEYLLSRSDNYIVDYSYYGDWAAPVASCIDAEIAASKDTPGILMSTGYSYFNCVMLAEFAGLLGLTGDVGKWLNLSRSIRDAFLDKWFDPETGRVATGSQGCQVFSLYMDLVPVDHQANAFDRLTDALEAANYTITTGNLNTRYLFDVLTKFGRADLAYKILTDERYPGYGFMLQNGATTIWERFELKKDPGMNSHDHPMYASVDMWFYKYILGIDMDLSDLKNAYRNYVVKPYMPSGLLSAQGWVMTACGKLAVRWKRTYGKVQLSVTVPYGLFCRIKAGDTDGIFESGEHIFEFTEG
jgi:alpha-L-rhamnosidase